MICRHAVHRAMVDEAVRPNWRPTDDGIITGRRSWPEPPPCPRQLPPLDAACGAAAVAHSISAAHPALSVCALLPSPPSRPLLVPFSSPSRPLLVPFSSPSRPLLVPFSSPSRNLHAPPPSCPAACHRPADGSGGLFG
ncbi:hypothetical protein HMPREF0551_1834 [Lautropia mirabilis ATCC 51599]|uniref:Uncharacterized protein n=1 Tax=Lautropia mirabilis ATCC 51599 TaxID=887898 RepID=E7RYS0_9BURK|nr:hypothetical protein HMPREF0551_1834 [Lautropia mirabilis ATCC 51599]